MGFNLYSILIVMLSWLIVTLIHLPQLKWGLFSKAILSGFIFYLGFVTALIMDGEDINILNFIIALFIVPIGFVTSIIVSIFYNKLRYFKNNLIDHESQRYISDDKEVRKSENIRIKKEH